MAFGRRKSFFKTASLENMKSFDRNKYFGPPLYNISKSLSLTASSIVPNRQPQPFYEAQGYSYPHSVYPQTYYPQIMQPQQRLFGRQGYAKVPAMVHLKPNEAPRGQYDGREPFELYNMLMKKPVTQEIREEKKEHLIPRNEDDGFTSIGREKWESE